MTVLHEGSVLAEGDLAISAKAGHGLAASLNVLPVTAPFYRMTERGFGIDAIAREINSKVRALLPVDRFIAATLVAVNFRERYVTVWNGGNPGPLLVRPDGGAGLSVQHSMRPFGTTPVPARSVRRRRYDWFHTRRRPALAAAGRRARWHHHR